MRNYKKNGELDIKETIIHTSVLIERHERYPVLSITMKLQRRPLFFVLALFISVILTSPLSAVAYFLLVESSEESTYSLTVLVFIVVLLVTISSYMPTISMSVSILGKKIYTIPIQLSNSYLWNNINLYSKSSALFCSWNFRMKSDWTLFDVRISKLNHGVVYILASNTTCHSNSCKPWNNIIMDSVKFREAH